MSRGRISLVVLDVAGTTLEDDDAVGRCLREALAGAGFRPTVAEVNAVMGWPKPAAIRHLLGAAGGDERVAAVHAGFVRRMLRFYAEDPSVREVPGTSEALRALREAGIKVALDTGFDRPIMRTLLARVGWERDGLIDGSVTSDEVDQGRPWPDMIRRLMADLGVADPRHVAKVGDTPSDLQEGASAGCGRVIGVTAGTHSREELARSPHTDLIGTVAELPGLLLG